MRVSLFFALVFLLACVASIHSQTCFKQVSAPVSASRVLGQDNFISKTKPGFSHPAGVAVSPSGKIITSSEYVEVGSPVFSRFVNTVSMIQGESPEVTFINKTTLGVCDASTTQSDANALHITADDTLWFSDMEGNRAVAVPAISTTDLAANPPVFSTLVGVDSPTACINDSDATMALPAGLFFDSSSSTIWVASQGGVFMFEVVTGQSVREPINIVGRGVSSVDDGCTPTNSFNPLDVAIDSAGNLWVVDAGFNRVLGYGPASAIVPDPDQPAIKIIGQTGFESCGAPAAQSEFTFNGPRSITFDVNGTLYVSDQNNHRVMIFLNAVTSLVNGQAADYQLGQPDFATVAAPSAIDAISFFNNDVSFDDTNAELVIADNDNNRVLTFCATGSIPASATASAPGSGVVSASAVSASAVSASAVSASAASASAASASAATSVVPSSVIASSIVPPSTTPSNSISRTLSSSVSRSLSDTVSRSFSQTVSKTAAVTPTASLSPSNPPTPSPVSRSAAVTPSKIVVCGDGVKDLLEQCDPPSVIGCCANDCKWAPIDQVCAPAQSVCHKERRCVYQNTVLRTGRQCGPGGLKAVGSRCSDYNPLKKCTADGQCL